MSLSAVRVAASSSAKPTAAVIFLHGLGDSGEGWSFLANEASRRSNLNHVHFVFPNAPQQPVTMNMGMRMPSWHDIKELDALEIDDQPGVMNSIKTVEKFIKEQKDLGIPSDRIVLGGFSQGAATTLAASVVTEHKLGGIMSLSGYIPCHKTLADIKKSTNEDTHTLMCHGTADDVVKYQFGTQSREYMKNTANRMFIEWHEYPGLGHSADPSEIEHVMNFLERVIPSE